VINRNLVSWIVVAVAALTMAGCNIVPILTVTSAPVNVSGQVGAQDIETAITRAGKILGWQMIPKGSGQIEGTLLLRTHKAVVDITYDAKAYSIKYKDSANLDYDGTNINRGYNRWVKSLDDTIKSQLKAL
jgi:hypothetical protein